MPDEGQPRQQDKSRELQRKLYLAAKSSRDRRFHALYDRIFRPDVLWRAWQEVRNNGGSAGVDGISIEDVECQGIEIFLHSIAQDLRLVGLQFTAEDGFPCYPLFENDANLNSLRKDERFITLMARVKQQWEHYQATF